MQAEILIFWQLGESCFTHQIKHGVTTGTCSYLISNLVFHKFVAFSHIIVNLKRLAFFMHTHITYKLHIHTYSHDTHTHTHTYTHTHIHTTHTRRW